MGKWKQFIAGGSAAFGAFCLGSSIGWSAPVELGILDGDYDFDVSKDDFSWIGSLLTLGAAFICIPIGFLITWLGRKPTMLLLIPPYILGWLLLIFAKNLAMVYAGRFILGMCGGAFCIAAPMYTTEIAELSVRGVLGSFFQLFIVHGILYAFVIGGYAELLYFNIACGILPLIFFIVFIFMPESPVYYSQKNKLEKAGKSLKWLRGGDTDTSAELSALLESANKEKDSKEEKPNTCKLICRKVTLKGLFISIMLMFFQQFTGINAIIFYSTTIFVEAGTGFDETLSTIIVGIIQVVATIISLFLIDRIGRRILLIVSSVGMALSTCLMGVYFYLKHHDPDSTENLGWLPVTSVCIFIISFSIGMGPVPWLVMAEIFSEDIKGVACSISGTLNWVFAFVVTKVFPVVRDGIGPAPTFWIFTGIAILCAIFVVFCLPETRGKTLSDIQDILENRMNK